MSTQVDPYVYEPLADNAIQIRVLELYPAQSYEDAISCELRTVDAPNASANSASGDYEAVSYAWGDATLTHTIWIDGCHLGITYGLDVALRHLRYNGSSRRLWVDAVCIDQFNDREKSHQVRMLQQVFSRAHEMLIWLGPGDEDTDDAMDFLQSNCLRFIPHDRLGRHPGLGKIFARAWWTRVWTAMELLFRKDPPLLGCGYYWASFAAVEKAMGFPVIADGFSDAYTKILGARSIRKWCNQNNTREDEGPRLSETLKFVSDRHASDPRDYIFAIAPLLPQTMRDLGLPNYSLPLSEVYQRATMAFLLSEPAKTENRLRRLFVRENGRSDIPSWCIDFSATDVSVGWNSSFDPGERVPLLPPKFEHDPSRGLLMVTGTEVDSISSTLRLPSALRHKVERLCANVTDTSLLGRRLPLDKYDIVSWIATILPFRGKTLDSLQRRAGKQAASQLFAAGFFWKFLDHGRPFEAFEDINSSQESCMCVEEVRTELRGWVPRMKSAGGDYAVLEHNFTAALSSVQCTGQKLASACADALSDDDLNALGMLALSLRRRAVFLTSSGSIGQSLGLVQEGDLITALTCIHFYSRPDVLVVRPCENDLWRVVAAADIRAMRDNESSLQDIHLKEKRTFAFC